MRHIGLKSNFKDLLGFGLQIGVEKMLLFLHSLELDKQSLSDDLWKACSKHLGREQWANRTDSSVPPRIFYSEMIVLVTCFFKNN